MTTDRPYAVADELLLIGRVGKTHGVRGEVKVRPETDDPERFSALDAVFIGASPEGARPYAVEAARYQQGKRGVTVVLKLAGIDTVDEAAVLRRQEVYAREADLPPLAEDEFFLHDLVGMRVVTSEGVAVGTVRDVLELPAHPVCVVARPGREDALIPAVPAFITALNIDDGTLVVEPIEGLL
jgi:16S rRNA processing protein RimM